MAAAAGCGGSSKAAKSGLAADAADAAGKTVSFEGDAVAEGMTGKLTGVLDFSGDVRADFTITIAASDDPKAPPRMRTVMDGEAEYRSAEAYTNARPQAAKALGGKHWVKSEASSVLHLNTSGAVLGAVTLETDTDLVEALAAVFESGVLKPDGAGHYAGTVDAGTLGASTFDAAHRAAITSAMRRTSVTAEKLEVWLGADGLPAEIKYVDDVAAGKKPSHADLRFHDWGKPVTVASPPASDTIGFDDFLTALKTTIAAG
ncbi:hypothetical protein GCM10009838_75120 [Catenulispora subtropica]|uniref:Lipoprotein n=1 Tax=Catenulispora subtropica TaxID=450798 RepID=A0ABN2T6S3_9ACTN